ncbi:MAG: hypothetical protein V4539_12210 [Bacteroidota bacterium]
MKRPVLVCILSAICFCTQAQNTADLVCTALNNIIADLEKGSQLDRLKGSFFSPPKNNGLEAQEFNATENFPLAQKTTLVDSSKKIGNPYRSIKALILKETQDSDALSATMQKAFTAFDRAFNDCLGPQKYSYTGPAQQIVKVHKAQSTFTRQIGRIPTTDNYMHIIIYIEQSKKDDKYVDELYMVIKRG